MANPWRILVTGSREWDDEATLRSALIAAASERPEDTDLIIVHGACPRGADAMADTWAKDYACRVERHPAEWGRFGKQAGFIRNTVMVEAGADECLAFVKDGSRGATHCAALAQRAGIPVLRFTA
jgi:YspA, cpYpsA-related SLOG family